MANDEDPDAEELSDRSWEGHRKRQLKALGVDPDKL